MNNAQQTPAHAENTVLDRAEQMMGEPFWLVLGVLAGIVLAGATFVVGWPIWVWVAQATWYVFAGAFDPAATPPMLPPTTPRDLWIFLAGVAPMGMWFATLLVAAGRRKKKAGSL